MGVDEEVFLGSKAGVDGRERMEIFFVDILENCGILSSVTCIINFKKLFYGKDYCKN
ncbi:MAG: hypothetical protein J6J35_01805 [Alphaproteobacteria bacterium]|nr:hypothetical protein [Alphaproteobacteria bacterium]